MLVSLLRANPQIRVAGRQAQPQSLKRKLGEDKPSTSSKDEVEVTHWLIKSEPEPRMEKGIDVSFGFSDLKKEPDSTACWDGVRNYSARNHMRAMKVRGGGGFWHMYCAF